MVKKIENLFDNLHPISKKELKNTCRVLANAFSEDPIIKELNLENEESSWMYEIPISYCLRYGNVFATSENLEGVIAFCPGNRANMKTLSIIRSGAIIPALKLRKIGKTFRGMFEILKEDKKNLNIGPYIYLIVIGVSQEYQGQGFGGRLIRTLVEKSEIEGKSIYLETQNEENIKLYEKFGFKILKKIILPGLNLPMWEMVRNSKNLNERD